MNTDADRRDDGANRDLISGAPGAHPVATGVGAMVGGAAAGALTGTVAGPIGTVIGAAVGAVVGGLAGKDVAEAIDPTREDAYWRENYGGRRYVEPRSIFDDDGPVYEFGVSAPRRIAPELGPCQARRTRCLAPPERAGMNTGASAHRPRPDAELVPPLTPDDRPSLLHPPRQVPPQIRQPDRPGEHMPIGADSRLSPSTRPRRLGACHD